RCHRRGYSLAASYRAEAREQWEEGVPLGSAPPGAPQRHPPIDTPCWVLGHSAGWARSARARGSTPLLTLDSPLRKGYGRTFGGDCKDGALQLRTRGGQKHG